MPTANGFTPGDPAFVVTITADDITALGAPFTTAEDIDLSDGAMSIEPVTEPELEYEVQQTFGGPLLSVAEQENDIHVWRLNVIDDEVSGGTGEYGTDNLTLVGIMRAFYEARRPISVVKISPDGTDVGKQEKTLTVAHVTKVGKITMSADAVAKATRELLIATDDEANATHS